MVTPRSITRYRTPVRSIVTRAAYASPYGRQIRSAMRAYNTGRQVYSGARRVLNFGRAAARTTKRMRNWSAKRRMKRRIGERVGQSNAKHSTIEFQGAMNTKTLYQRPLLDITAMSGSAEPRGNLDKRIRDVINLRGLKFCLHWQRLANITANDKARMWLNVAVISPKNADGSATIPVTDFFRSDGPTRSEDFTAGAGKKALDYRCLPINTDLYNIHKHGRYQVGPYESTEGRGEKLIEFYMPLKRQIRYEDNTTPVKNMYLVWWAVLSSEPDGAAVLTNVAFVDQKIIRYFRETATLA